MTINSNKAETWKEFRVQDFLHAINLHDSTPLVKEVVTFTVESWQNERHLLSYGSWSWKIGKLENLHH